MKIKADLLRIRTTPFDDKGDKVEPEAQPMQRVIQTDANVGMQGGGQVGSIPTEIQYETTVGEYAQGARHQCFTCKHFSRDAWKKLFSMWNDPTASIDKRKALNGIRAALLQTNNATLADRSTNPMDGDFDVEHAVALLGVCKPLTELRKDVVIVYPMSSCPPEVCSKTNPDGLYESRNKELDRVGSQEFDRIMRVAQGRPG